MPIITVLFELYTRWLDYGNGTLALCNHEKWTFHCSKTIPGSVFLWRCLFVQKICSARLYLSRCLPQSGFKFRTCHWSLLLGVIHRWLHINYFLLLNYLLYHCYLEPVSRYFNSLIRCFTRWFRLCTVLYSVYLFFLFIYGLRLNKIVNCKHLINYVL